jgi:hypothetical protein
MTDYSQRYEHWNTFDEATKARVREVEGQRPKPAPSNYDKQIAKLGDPAATLKAQEQREKTEAREQRNSYRQTAAAYMTVEGGGNQRLEMDQRARKQREDYQRSHPSEKVGPFADELTPEERYQLEQWSLAAIDPLEAAPTALSGDELAEKLATQAIPWANAAVSE